MFLQSFRSIILPLIVSYALSSGWPAAARVLESGTEQSLLLRWPVRAPASQHVTYQRWRMENTIVHFANHIYNNSILASVALDDLLENGIPAQIINGEFRDAVSAQELRSAYEIPEEFWLDPQKKIVLKRFIQRFFLTIHDDAKLNTSDAFIQTYYPRPNGTSAADAPPPYVIEYLHNMFGLNPWKIPDNATPVTVARYTAGQRAVRLLNTLDTQVSVNYFNTRENISRALAPEWIVRFVLKLEKVVDTIERWGNPYSELELNRPTLPESQYEVKMGKISERPVSNRNSNADQSPHRRLIEYLEQRYQSVAYHYEEFFHAVKILYANLVWVGIDEDDLHPMKKYLLPWILQNGERRPPVFDQKTLAWNIFKNSAKVRELFQSTATKALRNFDVRTIKFHLGQQRFNLPQHDLFQYLGLEEFLRSTSNDLQYLEWKNLLWYLKVRGRPEELELFAQWGKRFNHANGDPTAHSIYLWKDKLMREVADKQRLLENFGLSCAMEVLRLQLAF